MKISIICGSHRPKSESLRISHLLADRVNARGIETDLISLADNPLPLWDEGLWEDAPKWKEHWSPIAQRLEKSNAFIVVTPEWHGMAPSGLKNFFLLCGGKHYLAHKPGYIVAVSSGTGGAYPAAELRMTTHKNTRICYIPEQMIIRNVESVFANAAAPTELDLKLAERIEYGIELLLEYAKQMSPIREKIYALEKKFPYGL